jgi:hypothetical protein
MTGGLRFIIVVLISLIAKTYTLSICSGGSRHFCALLDEGAVRCWGRNHWGQLGRGDALDRVGRYLNTSGDALKNVDLGQGFLAKAIACGGDSTCAVLTGNGCSQHSACTRTVHGHA